MQPCPYCAKDISRKNLIDDKKGYNSSEPVFLCPHCDEKLVANNERAFKTIMMLVLFTCVSIFIYAHITITVLKVIFVIFCFFIIIRQMQKIGNLVVYIKKRM